MAPDTLPVLHSPHFPQVFDAMIERLISRAIVHLNFQEPDQARDVLLDALTEISFQKGENHGNASR